MPTKHNKGKIIYTTKQAAGKPRTYSKEEFDRLEGRSLRADKYRNFSPKLLIPFMQRVGFEASVALAPRFSMSCNVGLPNVIGQRLSDFLERQKTRSYTILATAPPVVDLAICTLNSSGCAVTSEGYTGGPIIEIFENQDCMLSALDQVIAHDVVSSFITALQIEISKHSNAIRHKAVPCSTLAKLGQIPPDQKGVSFCFSIKHRGDEGEFTIHLSKRSAFNLWELIGDSFKDDEIETRVCSSNLLPFTLPIEKRLAPYSDDAISQILTKERLQVAALLLTTLPIERCRNILGNVRGEEIAYIPLLSG